MHVLGFIEGTAEARLLTSHKCQMFHMISCAHMFPVKTSGNHVTINSYVFSESKWFISERSYAPMSYAHMSYAHMSYAHMSYAHMPLLKATVIHMCHSRWCLAKRNPGPSQNKTNTWLNQTLFDTAPLPLASWLPHGHELMWAWHVGCPVWTCLFVLLLFCSDGACADHLLKNCLVLHLFNCTCGNVTLQLRTASLAPTVELALVK